MTAVSLVAALAGAAPLLPFGIVDTHVHMMRRDNGINYTWAVPTAPEQCPCRPPCACNMALPEYVSASAALPADYVVFCEVSAVQEDWLREARWVQAQAEAQAARGARPLVGAILARTPPGFGSRPVKAWAADLDTLATDVPLLRGVRVYLNYPDQELLRRGLAELGRRGMVVDTFVPEITDERVHALVAGAPHTNFSIEHLGCGCDVQSHLANKSGFALWERSLARLAALPNVACLQLGGTMAAFGSVERVDASAVRPFVAAAVNAFGYERLTFEANWFFDNWKDSMDGFGTWARMLVPMLEELGATPADLHKVFRANAMRVYRIGGS